VDFILFILSILFTLSVLSKRVQQDCI